MSDLVKTGNNLPQISKSQIIKYLDLIGIDKNIQQKEKEMFIEVCMLNNLNPFLREAYIVAYGEGEKRQVTILTGYESYIKKAEETGLLDGWRSWTEGQATFTTKIIQKRGKNNTTYDKEVKIWGGNLTGHIEIYRKDWSRPYTHSVDFLEYVLENPFWDGKPKTMIQKVAESQGFRKCFSKAIGGMPYTKEEMPTPSETIDISHEIVKQVELTTETKQPEYLSDKKFISALEKLTGDPVKILTALKGCNLSEEQSKEVEQALVNIYESVDDELKAKIIEIWK